MSSFPVEVILPDLLQAIEHSNLIVSAPPGAGKSTVLPLALLPQTQGGKILLMQPRRVVVRNLATFLAKQLNEPVGQTIGYRIRGEQKISAKTKIEVITEGVLTRLIQADPELAGVKMIIFDEFHERNIHSDLGLALGIEVQQGLREDLRLLVMSATLETSKIQALLPDAVLLQSEGQCFKVDTHYTGNIATENVCKAAAKQVIQSLTDDHGSLLVFLPSASYIRQTQSLIEAQLTHHQRLTTQVLPLYGALTKEQQQLALIPSDEGIRKVILATNIAETSLTIEGIGVVIDSGREQVARFHPATGLTELTMQMISQASATQRQGRAGRLSAGVCYRLWSREQQDRLERHAVAQILREDVTTLMLNALVWGSKVQDLALIDQPSEAQLASAQRILISLGALDERLQLSAMGKQLLGFPCAPRLAGMLLKVLEYSQKNDADDIFNAACLVAAVAEERFNNSLSIVSECILALDSVMQNKIIKQMQRLAKAAQKTLSVTSLAQINPDHIGVCIGLAYPERIGLQRNQTQYTLGGGMGARVNSNTLNSRMIAVLDGHRGDGELQVYLWQPLNENLFRTWFHKDIKSAQRVSYNASRQAMEARQEQRFLSLRLSSEPVAEVSKNGRIQAWQDYLGTCDLEQWPLSDLAQQWLLRVELARKISLPQPKAYAEVTPWPHCTPAYLVALTAVKGRLARCKSVGDLAKLPWLELLNNCLDWPQQDALAQLLPTQIKVPSGNTKALTYLPDGRVKLAVKMQEMFGLGKSIDIAQGRICVLIELLSPAGRPIQLTDDLGRFWRTNYLEVAKEMKGRYPKHYWPQDPASAKPTSKTKKYM
jgi:ATP-dependent helicase HrpB